MVPNDRRCSGYGVVEELDLVFKSRRGGGGGGGRRRRRGGVVREGVGGVVEVIVEVVRGRCVVMHPGF